MPRNSSRRIGGVYAPRKRREGVLDRSGTAGAAFARRVFTVAGVYGILVLVPQYFMEAKVGRDYPPPITHPGARETIQDGCWTVDEVPAGPDRPREVEILTRTKGHRTKWQSTWFASEVSEVPAKGCGLERFAGLRGVFRSASTAPAGSTTSGFLSSLRAQAS